MHEHIRRMFNRQCVLNRVPYNLAVAQAKQESNLNPWAVSPVGAIGLMQVMPGTSGMYYAGESQLFDPELCLQVGLRYLRSCLENRKVYDAQEVSSAVEGWKMALACYNAGPGYTHVALGKARQAEGLPYTHAEWVKAGRPAGTGEWATWEVLRPLYASVTVSGRSPDFGQVTNYVDKIVASANKMGGILGGVTV